MEKVKKIICDHCKQDKGINIEEECKDKACITWLHISMDVLKDTIDQEYILNTFTEKDIINNYFTVKELCNKLYEQKRRNE